MPPLVNGKNRRWLTNVVFMGMGEPLANYDNVCQAIAVLNSPKGMGLGFIRLRYRLPVWFRKSAGLPDKICCFNLRFPSMRLTMNCVTVLFPSIEIPLNELIPACKEYTEKNGRNILSNMLFSMVSMIQ